MKRDQLKELKNSFKDAVRPSLLPGSTAYLEAALTNACEAHLRAMNNNRFLKEKSDTLFKLLKTIYDITDGPYDEQKITQWVYETKRVVDP